MIKLTFATPFLLCFAVFSPASAQTITFDELPAQVADGVSLQGVTFDFKISGLDSADALFGTIGPGVTAFTSDPGLEGNTAGTLSLNFSSSVNSLQFGVALLTNATLANGFTVSLFDPALASISTTGVGVATGGFSFSSGQFTYGGGPVSRAEITFNTDASRFLLDNLTFRTAANVPDTGSTMVLFGAALFGLGCVSRRFGRR